MNVIEEDVDVTMIVIKMNIMVKKKRKMTLMISYEKEKIQKMINNKNKKIQNITIKRRKIICQNQQTKIIITLKQIIITIITTIQNA